MKCFTIGWAFTVLIFLPREGVRGQSRAHEQGDASCRKMEIQVARLMDRAREIREKVHFDYQDDSVIAVENQITNILLDDCHNVAEMLEEGHKGPIVPTTVDHPVHN